MSRQNKTSSLMSQFCERFCDVQLTTAVREVCRNWPSLKFTQVETSPFLPPLRKVKQPQAAASSGSKITSVEKRNLPLWAKTPKVPHLWLSQRRLTKTWLWFGVVQARPAPGSLLLAAPPVTVPHRPPPLPPPAGSRDINAARALLSAGHCPEIPKS